jgi:hypothetical protein
MAVARQGACLANGAAEEMKMETPELDELIRGADGDADNVQYALCEVVGVRPTLCAQWVHRAPKGTKPEICKGDGRWSTARQAAQGSSKIDSSNQQK